MLLLDVMCVLSIALRCLLHSQEACVVADLRLRQLVLDLEKLGKENAEKHHQEIGKMKAPGP